MARTPPRSQKPSNPPKDNVTSGIEVVLDLDTIQGMANLGRNLVRDVADSLQATMSVLQTVHDHVRTLTENIGRGTEGYDKLAVASRKMTKEMERVYRVADILGRSVKGIGEQTEAVEESIDRLKKTVEGKGPVPPPRTTPGLPAAAEQVSVSAPSPGTPGGATPQMLGLLGQTLQAVSRDYLMRSIGGLRTYGPVGEVMSGYLSNIFGAGIASRVLGPIGAAVGLGIAAYQSVENTIQMRQRYTGMTGESGLGAALTYEAKAKLMSLSPWISGEQSRQIVESVLRSGYNREQAMTVMDYIAENVKSGLMDISTSLQFYQEAVDKARLSTVAMSETVEELGNVAATSRLSVEQAQGKFLQAFSSSIGQGLPPFLATGYAMTWTQAFANARSPQLREWPGPSLASPVTQFMLAQALNQQLPGTTVMNLWGRLATGEVTGAQIAQASWDAMKAFVLRVLGPFGVRPGMNFRDILNTVPGPVLQQAAEMMARYGLAPPGLDPFSFASLADNLINDRNSPAEIERRRMEANRITPGRYPEAVQEFGAKLQVGGYTSTYTGQQAISLIQGMSPEQFAQAIRTQMGFGPAQYGMMEMIRRGQFDPMLYRWLQSDAAKDALVRWRSSRYPGGFRELSLEEAFRLRPNEVFQALLEGSEEVEIGVPSGGRTKWTRRGIQGLIANQQLGFGTPSTQQVVIGFNEETARYMRVISGQGTRWTYGQAIARENYEETGGMPNTTPRGIP